MTEGLILSWLWISALLLELTVMRSFLLPCCDGQSQQMGTGMAGESQRWSCSKKLHDYGGCEIAFLPWLPERDCESRLRTVMHCIV